MPLHKVAWSFLLPQGPRRRLSSFCTVRRVSATTRMMWLHFLAGTVSQHCVASSIAVMRDVRTCRRDGSFVRWLPDGVDAYFF
ncbi:MAG: hypothetical protein Ct9H300mP13_1460 [Gammaproteobacteria bacterium]|nr:MAG: hypothetical protein Ct9H300mP13_1460 [Gammaproteobacteria bacterium]